jgi:hypothetical protein
MMRLFFGGQNFIPLPTGELADRLHFTRAFFQAGAAFNTELLVDVVRFFPFAANGPSGTTL